jgi:hypothetical protein
MRKPKIPTGVGSGYVVVIIGCIAAISAAQAQLSPPAATDVSPTVNTDVSSLIHTGSGYDAWTGALHRSITDLEVPGAVSSLGLKWVRTYNSTADSGLLGWSFSYTWRYWGQGWADPVGVRLPDGGIWRTNQPGTKMRFWRNCNGGPDCPTGYATLTLEDGSIVHMSFWVDTPDDNHRVDHFTPYDVQDPYGRITTLSYENAIPGSSGDYMRLKQITDPSGRFIKITYLCDNIHTQCTTSSWWEITHVEGSNGASVDYTWTSGGLTHVAYNDGPRRITTTGTRLFFSKPAALVTIAIVIVGILATSGSF